LVYIRLGEKGFHRIEPVEILLENFSGNLIIDGLFSVMMLLDVSDDFRADFRLPVRMAAEREDCRKTTNRMIISLLK
jgi:hypothetical protein